MNKESDVLIFKIGSREQKFPAVFGDKIVVSR
jgi:hypothetical protein